MGFLNPVFRSTAPQTPCCVTYAILENRSRTTAPELATFENRKNNGLCHRSLAQSCVVTEYLFSYRAQISVS
jgi:hypothetical protein